MDNIVIEDINPTETLIINTTKQSNKISVENAGQTVFSVNGKYGDIIITKADVGLDQVDNTSDLLKPISNATLSALLLKTNLSAFYTLNDLVTADYVSWNNVAAYINSTSFLNLTGGTITGSGNEEYTVKVRGGTTGDQLGIATDGVSGYGIHLDSIDTSGTRYEPFGIVGSDFYVNTKNGERSFILDNNGDADFVGALSADNISVNGGNSYNWNTAYETLSTLTYSNTVSPSGYYNLSDYLASETIEINKGSTLTLADGRIYIFAGNDPNDPNQYLEVNSNPITPIYVEVPLKDNNSFILDSYNLSDFKSAKYILQIETTFNNEIYYSEINVLGSILTESAYASEYGLISTSNIILGYQAIFNVNEVQLVLLFSSDDVDSHKLIVRGHRTNFFKI